MSIAIRRGTVDSRGVPIAYQVFGSGPQTLLFVPAWPILDHRLWTAQLAAFAATHRVVAYDPRGHGGSGRPTEPAAYDPARLVGDAVAVLEETGTESAVLVSNSLGTAVALLASVRHPRRVAGFVAIGTTLNVPGTATDPLTRALLTFEEPPGPDAGGWERYNRAAMAADYPGFARFFCAHALSLPEDDPLVQQAVDWALETTPEVLAATVAARTATDPAAQSELLRALAAQVRCPALVVHGSDDRIAPPAFSDALARALGTRALMLDGAGHCPQVTEPDRVNRILRDFADAHVR